MTLELPTNPQYRQFRIRSHDGTFHKIKRQIHTLKELRKELDKFEGDIKDIYYTTSLFSNPTQVGPKKKKKGYDPILIGSDLCFDIDSDGTYEGLEEARQQTIKLHDWLKDQPNILIDHIRFSNKKGFHIITKETKLNLPKQIGDRIGEIERKHKLFIDRIPQDIKIDKIVTTNPLGIIKMIGSLNPNNGLRTQKITRTSLNQPFPIIYRKLTKLRLDKRKQLNPTKPPYRYQLEKERQKTEHTEQVTYIKNKVTGTQDRYILILKYPLTYKLQSLDSQLRRLSKIYQLSNWYILEDQYNIYTINLKTCQPEQINKILAQIDSINMYEQNKYHTLRMPITADLLGIIELPQNHCYISKPHHNWLIQKFNITPEQSPTHGDESKLLITHATIKRYNQKTSEPPKGNDGIIPITRLT